VRAWIDDTRAALSEQHVDIVRQQYDLVTSGRRGSVPRTWTDDTILVVHEGSPDNGTYVGRDAAARWYESWFTKFTDDYVFEVEELREVGDAVVAIVRHHGTGRASGVPVEAETANVYWLRDGLVVRTEIFWNDVDSALRAAAGESP
jgi:ketosteroid isomerase-like protein